VYQPNNCNRSGVLQVVPVFAAHIRTGADAHAVVQIPHGKITVLEECHDVVHANTGCKANSANMTKIGGNRFGFVLVKVPTVDGASGIARDQMWPFPGDVADDTDVWIGVNLWLDW
jgi:hypothetical protein